MLIVYYIPATRVALHTHGNAAQAAEHAQHAHKCYHCQSRWVGPSVTTYSLLLTLQIQWSITMRNHLVVNTFWRTFLIAGSSTYRIFPTKTNPAFFHVPRLPRNNQVVLGSHAASCGTYTRQQGRTARSSAAATYSYSIMIHVGVTAESPESPG